MKQRHDWRGSPSFGVIEHSQTWLVHHVVRFRRNLRLALPPDVTWKTYGRRSSIIAEKVIVRRSLKSRSPKRANHANVGLRDPKPRAFYGPHGAEDRENAAMLLASYLSDFIQAQEQALSAVQLLRLLSDEGTSILDEAFSIVEAQAFEKQISASPPSICRPDLSLICAAGSA
jgi:hypothetical protein